MGLRGDGSGSRGADPGPDARWVDQPAQLEAIIDELGSVEAFAVDTEFHREKTYFPKLALLQLRWGDERALIDPVAIDLTPFAESLTSPATVVMHAASQDLEVLDLACGVLPTTLFDTQLAAGFVGMATPSLATLVERYYGVHLPKGDRLTDWLRRPLGPDQRTYAVADVEYLLDLRERLTAELTKLGRLEWFLDECEALRQRGRVVRDPDDAWRRIKEARALRGEVAGVAKAVAAWRERRAVELDQPVRFIMSDLAVVGIAQRRPTKAADLTRIRGVDDRQTKGKVGESILAAVAKGMETPLTRSGDGTHEIDRKLRPAVALVSAWVAQLARDISIETSLLATRSDIESLLAGDPASRLATGWRGELVGERIRQLVSGHAALAFDGNGNLLLEDRLPSEP